MSWNSFLDGASLSIFCVIVVGLCGDQFTVSRPPPCGDLDIFLSRFSPSPFPRRKSVLVSPRRLGFFQTSSQFLFLFGTRVSGFFFPFRFLPVLNWALFALFFPLSAFVLRTVRFFSGVGFTS